MPSDGLILQNELDAPPALFEDWLTERGIGFRIVRAWEGEIPADPTRFEWVASLGAADSVNQREKAWIRAEVELLRRAAAAEVPVLGICFGGQALSAALGGVVTAAAETSVGWFEIETSDPALVPSGPWAHFNSECFSVPDGATRLAGTRSGPGAFRLGPHLGVQFHPEATPTIVDAWAVSEAELLTGLGVDPRTLSAEGKRHGDVAARQAFELFDAWWAMSGDGA